HCRCSSRRKRGHNESLSVLFIAKRLDRVQLRGFDRRIQSGEHPDGDADAKTDEHRIRRKYRGRRISHDDLEMLDKTDAENGAANTSDKAQRRRFGDKLDEDVPTPGSEGFANSDL